MEDQPTSLLISEFYRQMMPGDPFKATVLGVREVGLAVVAGTFLYVAAADLLPEIQRDLKLRESALLVAGAAFMWVVTILF